MRPYENFDVFDMQGADALNARVNQTLRRGFSADGSHLDSLDPPIRWNGFPRPFLFRLHAWEPINDLLAAHSTVGGTRPLKVAAKFAVDWLQRFQTVALRATVEKVVSPPSEKAERFEWYDMAVGLRIYRLAYLAEALTELCPTPEPEAELFLDALRFHHRCSRCPVFFGHITAMVFIKRSAS